MAKKSVTKKLFAAASLATLLTMIPLTAQAQSDRVYELRTYHAFPGKLDDLHKRFREHTLEIFKRHNMKVVGFWSPTDKAGGSENTLVYVLEFPSREAATASWKAFRDDPEWQKVAKESEANGKLVEKVDSVFMKETDYAHKQ